MYLISLLWTKILLFSAITLVGLILMSLLVFIILSIVARYQKNNILNMQKIQLMYAYGKDGKILNLDVTPTSDYQEKDDGITYTKFFKKNHNALFPEVMQQNPNMINSDEIKNQNK